MKGKPYRKWRKRKQLLWRDAVDVFGGHLLQAVWVQATGAIPGTLSPNVAAYASYAVLRTICNGLLLLDDVIDTDIDFHYSARYCLIMRVVNQDGIEQETVTIAPDEEESIANLFEEWLIDNLDDDVMNIAANADDNVRADECIYLFKPVKDWELSGEERMQSAWATFGVHSMRHIRNAVLWEIPAHTNRKTSDAIHQAVTNTLSLLIRFICDDSSYVIDDTFSARYQLRFALLDDGDETGETFDLTADAAQLTTLVAQWEEGRFFKTDDNLAPVSDTGGSVCEEWDRIDANPNFFAGSREEYLKYINAFVRPIYKILRVDTRFDDLYIGGHTERDIIFVYGEVETETDLHTVQQLLAAASPALPVEYRVKCRH